MSDVLPYANPRDCERRSRLPLVAFLWSLCSPLTAGGILYLIVEGPLLDIDDLLPREAAIAVLALIVIGVPFAGVALSVHASARASTGGQRALSAAAFVLGIGWIIVGCMGLSFVVTA